MAITFKPAEADDIPALAAIRAQDWETEAYWTNRIGSYLTGMHSPQQALAARTALVALDGTSLVGFVAVHRTRRFSCDGEVQWINVDRQSRGRGIAGELLREIGAWFVDQSARRICVNVEPDNFIARKLYGRFGAKPLNKYWMIWEDSRDMVSPTIAPSAIN